MPPIDPSPLDALLRSLEPRLRALLRRHAGGRAGSLDLDELLQETRIRLWKVLDGEKSDAPPASAYLQQVVVSVVIDALRRRAARPEDANDGALAVATATTAGPEAHVAGSQRASALIAAIAQIGERRRLPTRLLLQGFSTAEIAELMSTSEATVRNLAYRGVEELRARLAGSRAEDFRDD